MRKPYLHIEDLNIVLSSDHSQRLLRDVNLTIGDNKICGIVGESGAGKSTIGKALLNILPKFAKIHSGKIWLEGENILAMSMEDRRRYCLERVSLIPQDPLTSLNPVRRISKQMMQPLLDLGMKKQDCYDKIVDLLEKVSIKDPARILQQYPYELSGGMRQRILIAIALALEPKLLIADEPTTALDVSVQKQILELILSLQKNHDMALMFITHDLGVVANLCHDVSVLYRGQIVESRTSKDFFKKPNHDYSKALLQATPCHTKPKASLLPVSEKLLEKMEQDIAKIDKKWELEYAGN